MSSPTTPAPISWRRRRARFFDYRQIVPLSQALKLAFGNFDTREEMEVDVKALHRRVRLRPGTSDTMVLRKIFVDDEYRPPFPLQPKTIVDAGAYIGLSALGFHRRYPEAVIHAIEPDARNFALLQKNCEGIPQIKLHHAALWPKPGFLQLKNPDDEPWSQSCQEASAGVPALNVEAMLEKCGGSIDLLKIDIEGAEKVLFESEPHRWLPKVKALAIELHDRTDPGCSQAFFRAIIDYPFWHDMRGENVFILFNP